MKKRRKKIKLVPKNIFFLKKPKLYYLNPITELRFFEYLLPVESTFLNTKQKDRIPQKQFKICDCKTVEKMIWDYKERILTIKLIEKFPGEYTPQRFCKVLAYYIEWLCSLGNYDAHSLADILMRAMENRKELHGKISQLELTGSKDKKSFKQYNNF